MNRILQACLCAALLCTHAAAQTSVFNADHQKMALLPGDVSGVSIVDGNLYCYASEILLTAQRSGEQLLGFWADTVIAQIADNVNYIVRHPATGDLYFTRQDKRGRSELYVCHVREDGKQKVKRIKMSGLPVEHPVFTPSGRIMIFSAYDRRRGFGGYDLWYSVLEGEKWSKPANLGGRINTSYDEMTPSVYRDCLLFSSNGQDADHAYLNIYSTRLISLGHGGDTASRLQIGKSKVQKLPEPLNSDDADDLDMIIDTARECGYWVSKRVDSDTDSQLFSFTGSLDGVLLTGRVTDKLDHLLGGVDVAVMQGGLVVAHTLTNDEGFYRIYLRSDQYYDVTYRLEGYFTANEQINTTKTDDEYLIAETRQNVELDRLLLGQRIFYEDLFKPGASLELSDMGTDRLEPLIQFLTDNPSMHVEATLICDLTDDANFNRMLTNGRMQNLVQYLYRRLPPSIDVNIKNGCKGECKNASGQARLAVVITDGEK